MDVYCVTAVDWTNEVTNGCSTAVPVLSVIACFVD